MTGCQPVRQQCDPGRFKNGSLCVIGLIGGIGGGKSEVAALLKASGAVVIDADTVGHELLNSPAIRARIVGRFGAGVAAKSSDHRGEASAIDRKALGAIVFADKKARQDLEAILHPEMRRAFLAVVNREASMACGEKRLVVLDAAILLEAGWDDLCDLIVFVDAPREERVRRVVLKRGWSREMFEARERAQWPSDEKRRRADLVVINDAEVESLRHQVARIVTMLDDPSRPLIEIANS